MIGDAWREIGAGGQVDGVSHAELLAAGGGILKIHDGRHEIVKPSMTDYPTSLPKAVPEGKRLVHNGVRPSRQGERGSRYWLADPGADLIPCDCGWARELGPHYRVFGARAARHEIAKPRRRKAKPAV
jgi:hypothetical protein